MSQIVKGLWLGGCRDASNIDFLDANHIDTVISICEPEVTPQNLPSTIRHVEFNIEDDPQPTPAQIEQFTSILEEASAILRKEKTEGRTVLVHCGAGRQRSAAVVAWHLACERFHGNVDEAMYHIMNRRSTAFRSADGSKVVNWTQSLVQISNRD
ncbi:phosphatases II [Gonapodya prolifera JEL478]|uniref:protein-tyrosine-phosphatase n=1 Tax=Gonapodya prolifera (strain JEL478) TaxID=1344416 RepID=A0A139AT95_GONPJ|nr:phosphatases II [Gonapodya prolifera JEL478]|eukprot:KXS19948.1 phosphatases II [Gonapodya prolifera JEL478]